MAFVNQTYAAIKDVLDKRVVLQMDDKIYLDRPSNAPFLAFMARNGKIRKGVKNMVFHHLTKKVRPPAIPISAAWEVLTPTQFPVATPYGAFFEVGGIFYFSGVQMRTTAVTPGVGAADDIVTAAPWPSTQVLPAADVAAGTAAGNLIMSYMVAGDNADAPKGNYTDTEDNFNYCEQTMRGITLNQIMVKSQKYGEDVRAMEHRLALMAYKTDWEMKFLFGQRYLDETNADDPDIGTIWNTGGINESITDKILNFGGAAFDLATLTAAIPDFEEFSEPDEWFLYVPASFIAKLEQSALGKMWLDSKDDSYGYAIKKWDTSFGSWPLIHSRMLDYLPVPTMYFINKNEVQMVPFEGIEGIEGAPRLYLNAQLPNQPNKIHDFFRGIQGIQRGFGSKHCKVYNWAP